MVSLFNSILNIKKEENPVFLYIGSESSSFLHEDATDYYDRLIVDENNRFIEDYKVSNEIILFCGREYNPNKIMVRLQKTFDYRQLSIKELFFLLGKDESLFDNIFEAKKMKVVRGIFMRPSWTIKYSFSFNGKQLLSNYLGKKIIYYDSPIQNYSDYTPERFSPRND